MFVLVALLTLTACGGSTSSSSSDDSETKNDFVPPSVTSVAIENAQPLLLVGDTLQLTANVDTVGGATQEVTWSSSDTNVADVNADGVVTAKALGTVTLTATSEFDQAIAAALEVSVVGSWTAPILQEDSGAIGFGNIVDVRIAIGNQGHMAVTGTTLNDFDGKGVPNASTTTIDGTTYTSFGFDGFVIVFDALGNELWRTQIRGNDSQTRTTASVIHQNYVVVSDDERTIRVFALMQELTLQEFVLSPGSAVNTLVIGPNGALIAGGKSGNKAAVWVFEANPDGLWNDGPARHLLIADSNWNLTQAVQSSGGEFYGIVSQGTKAQMGTFRLLADSFDSQLLLDPLHNVSNPVGRQRFAVSNSEHVVTVHKVYNSDFDPDSHDAYKYANLRVDALGDMTVSSLWEDGPADNQSNDTETSINGVAFTLDGNIIVAGGTDNALTTNDELASDTTWQGSNNGYIRIFAASDGSPIATYAKSYPVLALTVDATGRIVTFEHNGDDRQHELRVYRPDDLLD